MLSQTAEYALRAAVHLASQKAVSQTAAQIAEATHVPTNYLAKVLQVLAKANIVKSQRGLHGGFVLGRSAEQITILEVVQAVDPIQRIRSCPLGLTTHRTKLCALHERLDMAIGSVENALRSSTLHDLVVDNETTFPLCESQSAKLDV